MPKISMLGSRNNLSTVSCLRHMTASPDAGPVVLLYDCTECNWIYSPLTPEETSKTFDAPGLSISREFQRGPRPTSLHCARNWGAPLEVMPIGSLSIRKLTLLIASEHDDDTRQRLP